MLEELYTSGDCLELYMYQLESLAQFSLCVQTHSGCLHDLANLPRFARLAYFVKTSSL